MCRGLPSLLYNGCGVSFLGVKRPGRTVEYRLPSFAEIKERVQQYVYSPSGPSLCVLGWNLAYSFTTLAVSVRFSQQLYPAGLQPTLLRFMHGVAQVRIYLSENLWGRNVATPRHVRPKKQITSEVEVSLLRVAIIIDIRYPALAFSPVNTWRIR